MKRFTFNGQTYQITDDGMSILRALVNALDTFITVIKVIGTILILGYIVNFVIPQAFEEAAINQLIKGCPVEQQSFYRAHPEKLLKEASPE